VTVDGPSPTPAPSEVVAADRWPFLPVLRVTTLPQATVAVAYTIVPEPGQRLETSYGINPERWIDVPSPHTRFAIAVREGDTERDVWSAEIDPMTNPNDRRWATVHVDLAPWAGRTVELVLRVRGTPGAPMRTDSAGWGDPRLVGGRMPS
jgi:hypothetical protein